MGQPIYLDTYVLQQDLRVRLPKAVLNNLNLEKGKSCFDIYLDSESESIIFKLSKGSQEKIDRRKYPKHNGGRVDE